MNSLIATVLDLDVALGGNADLLLGGGLGLYLKQEHLRATGARTVLPLDRLPQARTTEDIDLFLRAEVIASRDDVLRYRGALDSLGFEVVEEARWMKFKRAVRGVEVVLDVMVGPLGEYARGVKVGGLRVRPRDLEAADGLHARRTDDALGVERSPMRLVVEGTRSDTSAGSCEVLVPRAFPYAIMKLGALHDRIDDVNKQEGRHHAMDLYRIVWILTEEEAEVSARLAADYSGDARVAKALRTIDSLLAPRDGLGRIRLLEYQRTNRATCPELDPEFLVAELRRLLSPPDD